MAETQRFEKGEHWYCVRSKPKKERMAAGGLESLHGLAVFCPQIRFQRKTVRGPVWFQEAMFPGYLFARFDLFEMKRAVSYAPGVLNIPMFDGHIVPVPDCVIESLQKDLDAEVSDRNLEHLGAALDQVQSEGGGSRKDVHLEELQIGRAHV